MGFFPEVPEPFRALYSARDARRETRGDRGEYAPLTDDYQMNVYQV